MKRLVIVAISMIAAIGAAPVLAQTQITTNSQMAREIIEISPSDLVSASYQGRFSDQGIPSAGRFISAIRYNKIKAKDLVEVAIAKGRLSEATLQDKSYLGHVESVLNNLDRN